jgi:hypothetical protein
MELTAREIVPRAADILEPVISEGVETVIPPAAEVLTAPLKLAEVPAETLSVEAVIAWVVSVVPDASEDAPVVVTAPFRLAAPELVTVKAETETAPAVIFPPPTVARDR